MAATMLTHGTTQTVTLTVNDVWYALIFNSASEFYDLSCDEAFRMGIGTDGAAAAANAGHEYPAGSVLVDKLVPSGGKICVATSTQPTTIVITPSDRRGCE